MQTLVNITQPWVRVAVDYYDAAEKAKFAAYPAPTPANLASIAGTTISIPTARFLTFYLFQQMRQGLSGLSTVAELQWNLRVAEGQIGPSLHFDGQSLRLPTGANPKETPAGVIERFGEAIGLSVASHIHGLIESDWQRLQEPTHAVTGRKMKGLDFHQAATSTQSLIQLEAKGSAMDDNRLKTGLSAKVASIQEKKVAVKSPVDGTPDLAPNAIRYGTVSAADYRPGSIANCRLVDPEPDPSRWTPTQFKVLSRLHSLTQLFAYVSPRSPLTSALTNRSAALLRVTDPLELDRVPLLHGDGTPFEYSPEGIDGKYSTFFAGKSRVEDMPAGGTAFMLGERTLAFLGVRQELIAVIANQDFDALQNYKFLESSKEALVKFSMSRARFETLPQSNIALQQPRSGNSLRSFELQGIVHSNESGMVFGFFEYPR